MQWDDRCLNGFVIQGDNRCFDGLAMQRVYGYFDGYMALFCEMFTDWQTNHVRKFDGPTLCINLMDV